jgi:hypothetical protein
MTSTARMAAGRHRLGSVLRLAVSTVLTLTGSRDVLPQRLRYPRQMSGARKQAVRPAVQHSAHAPSRCSPVASAPWPRGDGVGLPRCRAEGTHDPRRRLRRSKQRIPYKTYHPAAPPRAWRRWHYWPEPDKHFHSDTWPLGQRANCKPALLQAGGTTSQQTR